MKIKVMIGSGECKAFLKLLNDNGYSTQVEESAPAEVEVEVKDNESEERAE